MPAVAAIVFRLLEKRRAGTRARRECRSVVCSGRAGRGLARHFRLGTRYEYRHQVDEACCRSGGVAGAPPPHKGGPNRPDRPEMQWAVVSGQRRCSGCLRFDREVAMVWSRPEDCESSPPFWDVPFLGNRLLTPPNCVSMNQANFDPIDTGKPYVRLHRMRNLESR